MNNVTYKGNCCGKSSDATTSVPRGLGALMLVGGVVHLLTLVF